MLILGSTGSIGTQALEVIAANPDRFEVVGLAAGRLTRGLKDQGNGQQGKGFGAETITYRTAGVFFAKDRGLPKANAIRPAGSGILRRFPRPA